MSIARAIGRQMENQPGVGQLLKAHANVLGRVAMALLGDATQVERALEQVAREAGAQKPPESVNPLAWLLGFVRTACATQMSRLPIRNRTQPMATVVDAPSPDTERLGSSEASPARASLASLKPTEREAVVLSLVGGLEASDVAIACNIDVASAKARIARGVEQMLSASTSGNSNQGGAR